MASTGGPCTRSGSRREGRTIIVRFHAPVLPLRWDDAIDPPLAWPGGRGFEVRAGATHIDIGGVAIVGGDSVRITCAGELPASGLVVGYALTSGGAVSYRACRGPIAGGSSATGIPSSAVASGRAPAELRRLFELPVP